MRRINFRLTPVYFAGFIALTVLLSVGAGLLAWEPWKSSEQPAQPSPQVTSQPEPTTPSPDPTPEVEEVAEPIEFTIGAVGDVLLHDTPIRVAHQGGSDYDFTPLLESTRAWSEGVDLAICNMEVPLALPGEAPSGYPLFGAPEQIVHNLADLGWNGCSTGTNHTLDRGPANAEYTLDMFDEHGLGHVGSARSEQEAQAAQVYEIDREDVTVKVAQIGATYGTNGLPIPEDKPWVVNLLDADSLIDHARKARQDGADMVIATLHWGIEYDSSPSPDQTSLAQTLADSGLVDLIIGTHPHVPQPYAKLEGGPEGEGMWVAYSLGNFISNQDSNCCVPETATGLFLTASVSKEDGEAPTITGLEWTPITVDRRGDNIAYPLLDILEDPPASLTLNEAELRDRLQRVEQVMENSTGADFAMRSHPPTPTGPPPVVVPR